MQDNATLTGRLSTVQSQLDVAETEHRTQRETILRLMNDQQNVAQFNVEMDNLRVVCRQLDASYSGRTLVFGWRGGFVVGRRTCDLVVAGSRPGRDATIVLHLHGYYSFILLHCGNLTSLMFQGVFNSSPVE